MATCPDLGHSVDNGDVSYSRDPTEQGRYVENTTITVSCDEGYRGGGDIICHDDGKWPSSSLPSCTSESTVTMSSLVGCTVYEEFDISIHLNLKVWEMCHDCQKVRS